MRARIVLSLLCAAAAGAGASYLLTDKLPERSARDAFDARPAAGAEDPGGRDGGARNAADGANPPLAGIVAIDGVRDLDALIRRTAALPPSPGRRVALEALLLRYAETHPARAIERARELELGRDTLAVLYAEWSRRDAPAALDALAGESDQRTVHAIGIAMLEQLGDAALPDVLAALPAGMDPIAFRIEAIAHKAATSPQAAFAEAFSLDRAQQSRAFQRIAAAWALEDPLQALAGGEQIADPRHRMSYQGQVVRDWARRDPQAVFRHLADGGDDPGNRDLFVRYAFDVLAEDDPARLFAMAARDSGSRTRYAMASAIELWARNDPTAAIHAAGTLPFGRDRDLIMQSLASGFAATDPDAALAWIETLDPKPRDIVAGAMRGLARVDTERALRIAMSLQDRHEQMQAMQNIVFASAWYGDGADTNVEQLAQGILALPEGETRTRALQALGQHWGEQDPEQALAWMIEHAQQIPADGFGAFASQLARRDPQLAAGLTARIPQEARGNWIMQVAAGLGRSDPQQAMAWLDQFQGDPAYEAGVAQVARYTAESDPQAAARLIDGMRNRAYAASVAGSTANAWSSRDPAAAARWAAGLQDEQARDSAVGVVAYRWGTQDAPAASGWALGLPRGNTRDQALTGVLRSAAEHRLPLAPLIHGFTSDLARQQAVAAAVHRLARSRPAEARALIDRYLSDPSLKNQAESALLWSDGYR